MIYLNMASRNIFRAKRRSFVTIAAMAFGLGIMVAFSALHDGILNDMRRNASLMEMGHLQIHPRGYLDQPGIYTKITDPKETLLKINSMGFNATPRLFASGLAAFGNASSGVSIEGVDPETEKKVVRMPKYIMQGTWLSTGDDKSIVIGKSLAKSLHASPGDEIVLVSQAADGSTANALFKVRGILKSVDEEINRAGLFMTIDAFRNFISFPSGIHEIAISLQEGTNLDIAGRNLKQMFPGYDVKTWKELNPAVAEMLDVSASFQIPMIAIIYIAIGILVLNAMLMAVFERIREYGVMKAVGVTPLGIFRLVAFETFIMIIIASVIGLALGIPLSLYLQWHGIDLSGLGGDMAMSGVALDPVLRATLTARNVYIPMIVLAILSGLAAVYPAAKAAKINPVKAIYFT